MADQKYPKGSEPTKEIPSHDNAVVIQLPESDMIQAAKLKPKALEELVRSILGGQTARGIGRVILKGGRASGPLEAPASWIKTLWTRNC